MKHLLFCEFNIDTACVELKYSDGSMIAIYGMLIRYTGFINAFARNHLARINASAKSLSFFESA